ncbi:MAG: tRNA glutamyl-Q(34) synthetase GluQRS [Rhodobacterales bacterium]|nr:tRNA glutamyl-Q(34) synthetase GluQRS [Rhodobacterales bacterium]
MACGAGLSYVTRFAPSPTGLLHLGHAFSALTGFARAQAAGGRFLLRIEDLDRARCRPEWEAAILADLRWLGLHWPEPVMRQSDRGAAYGAALDRLAALGVLYPCSCTRGDIRAALSAPQEGAGQGPDGPVYPGTCRGRSMAAARPGDALRLDLGRAVALTGPVGFAETGPLHPGRHRVDPADLVDRLGDVVLARRDGVVAYHLAVVVDDAAQRVSEVTRGADLFEFTGLQRILQVLLDLPEPAYHHHDLIRDAAGKRLAKRDDARSLASLRDQGATPADIRRMVGL